MPFMKCRIVKMVAKIYEENYQKKYGSVFPPFSQEQIPDGCSRQATDTYLAHLGEAARSTALVSPPAVGCLLGRCLLWLPAQGDHIGRQNNTVGSQNQAVHLVLQNILWPDSHRKDNYHLLSIAHFTTDTFCQGTSFISISFIVVIQINNNWTKRRN